MKSICAERFLSVLSDETECSLYPKRIKIESSQKCIEKEEQQKLGQNFHCVSRCQISPHEPTYLPERQNNGTLEKQSCETERKTCMGDFFHFQTCRNKILPCRVSENKLFTKKWNPGSEDQATQADDVPLNVHRQPLEKELPSVQSAANTSENLQVLNPPQMQPSYNIEQNNKGNDGNELKSSSVTPLNRDLFQMDFLSHKSVSDKKWKQYQVLPIPFLCGTTSVFSHMEQGKNNFLKKGCSSEDKDFSSSDNESTAEGDNKENNNFSSIIPTLKPFKSIQPLKIPNFLLPSISNKRNSKIPSPSSKETYWKTFPCQPSFMQSKQIHSVQKKSEKGKQESQNVKETSTVSFECKEKNYSSTSKQESSALAEEGKVSVTCFRGNSTDIECYQIFSEKYFKDEMLESSDDDDDDQKLKIHSYINAKNIQNEKCVNCNDLLKRMVRKTSNKNVGTFHTQTSIPVIREPTEKKPLDILCGVHNSNCDVRLYEPESKLSTKKILDFKRYLPKNILFESISPHIIVQDISEMKGSCNIIRGKDMFKLKFSFQNMVFAWPRTWTEYLHEDMLICQDDSGTHCFHFHQALNGQSDAHQLNKSNIYRNHNSKIFIYLMAVISKHLKAELQSRILPSFSNSTNTLLPTEGKPGQVKKQPLCGRRQDQLNLWHNTEFHKKRENYPDFVNLNFVEIIGLELYNQYQRSNFSRALGEQESNFLERGTLFHKQKSGIRKGRHVRKHHLLSRGNEWFTNCLRSVSCKSRKKKQTLVAKCLFLLQGSFSCSLDKLHFCSITKIQCLIGANIRFWSYSLAHSQLKFGKVNSKCTNQEIAVTTVKQERKKQRKMFNSSFLGERFKAFPFVLWENKKEKATECRNCLTSTNGVTNEVNYTMKKYLDTSYINGDRKVCDKSKELQIHAHNFLSKKSCSIIDTYEKIPLTSDSEDFDQIPIVNHDNSARNLLSKENAVTSSKEFHNLPAIAVLIQSEQSKTAMEECSSLLLQHRQANKAEYCKRKGSCSPHLANKKVEDQNSYSEFENSFPSSSNVFQCVTLQLDSSPFASVVAGEDGHHKSSSSADKQNQREEVDATEQYPPTGTPAMTEIYSQAQGKETALFAFQGHAPTSKSGSLEPAALKQHLEYLEQEEISDEHKCVTNESQCETLMNDLIMSHSEDESQTFIAEEEKLKKHLSIMDNGCLEDVKDKYLPLENEITYELELKRKFGLVLEELHMFHEISKGNESNLSSLETNSHRYCELNNFEGIDENVTSASQKKICTSPICGSKGGQNITDSDSLNEKISTENEDQKTSKEDGISRLSSEERLHSPVAEGYFDATYKKPYMWNPAFLACTLLNEHNYNLQEEGGYFLSRGVIRIQPLKTCKGPIRIGLSRKARPKQLHPYLK